MLELNHCYCADAVAGLRQLETGSVNCVVTSPPYYGLRDYGIVDQIGLEASPEEYISRMVGIFREVWYALRDDGTLWINMGDSYAANRTYEVRDTNVNGNRNAGIGSKVPNGMKPKDLMGIPWMLAFALRADGWYLRQDIIWAKPNPMPESVRDRCTKAHEYIFLLSKQERYYFDQEAIKEPAGGWNGSRFEDGKNSVVHPNVGKQRKPAGWDTGKGSHGSFHRAGRTQEVEYSPIKRSGNLSRKYGEERDRPGSHLGASVPWEGDTKNKRDVWTVSTQPFKEAHFATFPPELIKPCILAGCPEGGTVCDPFMGSGTTLVTANELDRNCIGFDLNPDYCDMANRRRAQAMAQQSFFRKEIKES